MGFLDKLQFWKKKDSFGDLPDFGGSESMSSGQQKDPFGAAGLGNDLGAPGLGADQTGLGSVGTQQPGLSANQTGLGGPGLEPSSDFGAMPPMGKFPSAQTPPQQAQTAAGGFGAPGMKPFGSPQQQHSPPPPPMDNKAQFSDYKLQKDVEIVSYKLDSLKSAIDSINQRIANIERLAFDAVNK
jgi:hypothetical protein